MYGWTDSPCVLQDFVFLRAAAQKLKAKVIVKIDRRKADKRKNVCMVGQISTVFYRTWSPLGPLPCSPSI